MSVLRSVSKLSDSAFQTIVIKHNTDEPPLLVLLTAHIARLHRAIKMVATRNTPHVEAIVRPSGTVLRSEAAIARLVARCTRWGPDLIPEDDLLAEAEIDEWMEYAHALQSCDPHNPKALSEVLKVADTRLALRTFFVGYAVSLADLAIWCAIRRLERGNAAVVRMLNQTRHVKRWFTMMDAVPTVCDFVPPKSDVAAQAKAKAKAKASTPQKTADKGSSEDELRKLLGSLGNWDKLSLTNAEKGKVVTRFPPEPSGYLHVGHAKALFLNQFYAEHYDGKMLLRFDDTNPMKEKEEFEDAILEDLKRCGIDVKSVSHTSDHFDTIQNYCDKIVKEGHAFVDQCSPEEVKKMKWDGIESPYRNQTIEENVALWEEMKKGSMKGSKLAVRLKMNMQDPRKCLRDPTIYRVIADTPHARTGTKYKVYPLYDFACPIVDSIEGVTHALRTSEYHDRNELYAFVLDLLGLRKVYMEDYSRLNFKYTLLSKRKLKWFVDNGKVSGWDDPAFPTVRGMLRRGLTVKALKLFNLAAGASKRIVNQDTNKMWAINKTIIDPECPRHHAVGRNAALLSLENFDGKDGKVYTKDVARHQKIAELGKRKMYFAPKLYIEATDAEMTENGEEITLREWGNCIITSKTVADDGSISFTGKLNPDGDFKKTKKKLHWLPVDDSVTLVQLELREHDTLITKEKLEKDDNFEQFVNPTVMQVTTAFGDPALADLKVGDRLQLERRGYFIVDAATQNPLSMVLNMIPDGKTKSMSVISSKVERKGGSSADGKKRG